MKRVDVGNLLRHYAALMLTLGAFSIVVATFIGCVWWACRDEGA